MKVDCDIWIEVVTLMGGSRFKFAVIILPSTHMSFIFKPVRWWGMSWIFLKRGCFESHGWYQTLVSLSLIWKIKPSFNTSRALRMDIDVGDPFFLLKNILPSERYLSSKSETQSFFSDCTKFQTSLPNKVVFCKRFKRILKSSKFLDLILIILYWLTLVEQVASNTREWWIMI